MSNKLRDILFYTMITLFLVITATRLSYLQLIQGNDYYELAEINRIRTIKIPSPRGIIYSRDGEVLVDNKSKFSVMYMLPDGGEADQKHIEKISEILHISQDEFRQKLSSRPSPFYPAVIKENVDFSTVAVIEEKCSNYDEIFISSEPVRHYPHDSTACHLLGYCSEVDKDTLERDESGELTMGDITGRAGIEYTYDEYLRGINGKGYIQVNALEEKLGIFKPYDDIPPTSGYDLYLTIDLQLQKFCEQYLEEKVGAIVVMEPNSGDVLALASNPGYNPSLFSDVFDEEKWSELLNDEKHPLLNRAISGTYPAGSTYKIVVSTAGLELGVTKKGEHMEEPCWGGYAFGNRVYHCWARGTGHGFLDLPGALKNSCNVYFFQLGLRVGMDGLEEYADKYNLGEYTGIELYGEKKGQRPSIERLIDKYGEKWPRGEILNNSVGQGQVLVTPVQMCVLMSALANNEHILKPQLVKMVKSPYGDFILQNRREVIKPFHISEESRGTIVKGLKMVVDRILPNPLNLVGKTGSAENPHGETHAWFVGFGPMENPKIAFAILVEHGEYGEYHIPWALKLLKFCKENQIPDNNW